MKTKKKLPVLKRWADLDSIQALRSKLIHYGSGKTREQLAGVWRVRVADLRVLPNVFQARDSQEEPWVKEAHARAMEKAAREGAEFPPILVLFVKPSGNADAVPVVVEGHHRAGAVLRAGGEFIRVKVHQGTLGEALAITDRANRDAKLPLTTAERTEAAWRGLLDHLLGVEEGQQQAESLRELAARLGVGKTTVERMVGYFQEHRADILQKGQQPTWKGIARELCEATDAGDWLEQEKERTWERLCKAFGASLPKKASLLADLLRERMGMLGEEEEDEEGSIPAEEDPAARSRESLAGIIAGFDRVIAEQAQREAGTIPG